jgi:hypothetical protein
MVWECACRRQRRYGALLDRRTESETERRSLVHLRLSPDASSMLSDDSLHSGESYPGAFKLHGPFSPLSIAVLILEQTWLFN